MGGEIAIEKCGKGGRITALRMYMPMDQLLAQIATAADAEAAHPPV